jgi:hypothetical protein
MKFTGVRKVFNTAISRFSLSSAFSQYSTRSVSLLSLKITSRS